MRRRAFLSLLGVAATWRRQARAQQPKIPVIGFLNSFSPDAWEPFVAAFRKGLKAAGFIEGETVVIVYRWAHNHPDQLPGLAAELVRAQVSVIVASGGDGPVQAARQATATIPIVATM